MSNVDTKKTAGRRAGRPPGSKKKVVRSPKKSDEASAAALLDPVAEQYCPCKDYMEGELSVSCDSCEKYWHLCCVGLRGLTAETVTSLECWQCPDCYTCPHTYKEKPSSDSATNADCGTMRVLLRDELHSIQPVIKVTVENAVRKLLPKTVCSKEDVHNAVKSYADVTRESQKKVIEQASITQSSKTVVENVVRKLDADKIEREKRKLNVVVLNVPEPDKDLSKEEKKEEDTKFCNEVLDMSSEDFELCWRAGKIDESKPGYCRPLIIKMVDDKAVEEWTRDGKGLKLDSGHWVNKDMCSADRRAYFLARQERRKRIANKDT